MYTQAITQNHKSAIIFCLDCSTSMQEIVEFNGMLMSKAEVVTMVTNIMIDELIIRASRHNNLRYYYDIAVIGYHGNSVENLLTGGHIAYTPITQFAEFTPKRCDYCFKQHISNNETVYANFVTHEWIKPKSEGKTPMYEALIEVYRLVDEWCLNHLNRDSFPPIVFHITDGNATDGKATDLISIANDIKHTGTNDGHTLLVNVHIGSGHEYCSRGVLFPSYVDRHSASEQMATLFAMSSEVPNTLLNQLPAIIANKDQHPRLVAYNISPCELLNIVNIGSESIRE